MWEDIERSGGMEQFVPYVYCLKLSVIDNSSLTPITVE